MTAKHPDFTDVFYAKAKIMDCARKGLRLQDAGDKKGARAAYREALRWEKEVARLEKIVKAGGSASSARAHNKSPRRKAPS